MKVNNLTYVFILGISCLLIFAELAWSDDAANANQVLSAGGLLEQNAGEDYPQLSDKERELVGSIQSNGCLYVLMLDSFGDGWNGYYFEAVGVSSSTILETVTLTDGVLGYACLLLPPSNSYYFQRSVEGSDGSEASYFLCGQHAGMASKLTIYIDESGNCLVSSVSADPVLSYSYIGTSLGSTYRNTLAYYSSSQWVYSNDYTFASVYSLFGTGSGYWDNPSSLFDTYYTFECNVHGDCDTLYPFCYDGICTSCDECQWCSDGVDNTCGDSCGTGYLYNETICDCVSEAGTYCSNTAGEAVYCGKGNYCPYNSTSPTTCPTGYYCDEDALDQPKECEIGYYCPDEGQTTYTTYTCDDVDFEVCPFTGMESPETCVTDSNDMSMCWSAQTTSCTGEDSGDGETITYTCVCTALYTPESLCTEKVNITNSYIVAFITLFFSLVLTFPCLCCDGLLYYAAKFDKVSIYKMQKKIQDLSYDLDRKTKSVRAITKQKDLDPNRQTGGAPSEDEAEAGERKNTGTSQAAGGTAVATGMAALQHGASAVEASQRLASAVEGADRLAEGGSLGHTCSDSIWFKRLMTYVYEPLKFILAYASVFLVSYTADLGKMIANCFLIVKSLAGISVKLDVDVQMTKLLDELREFLPNGFDWIADMFEWFVSVFDNFNLTTIAFSSMQVDCAGSKAPAKLFTNILVVVCVVFLYEIHFLPFLRITFKKYTGKYQRGAKTITQKAIGIVMKNFYLAFESCFKYFIQLGVSVSQYKLLLKGHSYTSYCQNDMPLDAPVAIISSILCYFFGVVIFHVAMRCFIWGLPQGVSFKEEEIYEHFPKRCRAICCHTRAVHFHSDKFYDDEEKNCKKSLKYEADNLEAHDDDLPCLMDILVLIFKEAREKKVDTLKNYLWTLVWKMGQLCKLTIGWWDESLLKSFHIKEMGKRVAIEEDACDEDVISMYGQSNSLVWQIQPLFLTFSKLGEYANVSPLFVNKKFKDGTKLKLTYKFFNSEIAPSSSNIKEEDKKKWATKAKWALSLLQGRFVKWVVSVVTFTITMLLATVPSSTLMYIFCYFTFPTKFIGSFQVLEDMGLLPESLDFLAPALSAEEKAEMEDMNAENSAPQLEPDLSQEKDDDPNGDGSENEEKKDGPQLEMEFDAKDQFVEDDDDDYDPEKADKQKKKNKSKTDEEEKKLDGDDDF